MPFSPVNSSAQPLPTLLDPYSTGFFSHIDGLNYTPPNLKCLCYYNSGFTLPPAVLMHVPLERLSAYFILNGYSLQRC